MKLIEKIMAVTQEISEKLESKAAERERSAEEL